MYVIDEILPHHNRSVSKWELLLRPEKKNISLRKDLVFELWKPGQPIQGGFARNVLSSKDSLLDEKH